MIHVHQLCTKVPNSPLPPFEDFFPLLTPLSPCCPSRCEVVSHFGYNLHSPSNYWQDIFSQFAHHLKTFSHDIAVKPSAHFPLDRVVYFCCCRAAAVLYVLWTPTLDQKNSWQVFSCTLFLSGLSVSCTQFWWSIFFPSVASSVCAISMNLLSSPSLRILFLFQILKLIAYF